MSGEKEPRAKQKEQYKPPQTIEEARHRLLKFRGIENYVQKSASVAEIDKGLDHIVEDVTTELQAQYEIAFITNAMGWSQARANAFFDNEQHKPFKSGIKFSQKPEVKRRQILDLGSYLRFKYQLSQNERAQESASREKQERLEDARKRLASYYEQSNGALFVKDYCDWVDRYNGIDLEDRRKGTIKPVPEMVAMFSEETQRVAQELNLNVEDLAQEVNTVTLGGNFVLAETYLRNNKGSEGVRRVLERLSLRRALDPELTRQKLALLWQTALYRMELGMDLEMYYAINGFPPGQEIERRIDSYLNNEDGIDGLKTLLREEATTATSRRYWDIVSAIAEYCNWPDKPSDESELEKKKLEAIEFVKKKFPFAAFEFPRVYFDAPPDIGASQRPFNFGYKNIEGKLVIIDVLNVRVGKGALAVMIAHEGGHMAQAYMLEKAEQAGMVEKGAYERVEPYERERFANLLQSQISIAQRGKSSSGQKESNLYRALLWRRQFVYSMIQRIVLLKMEEMFRLGKRDGLTRDEEDKLTNDLQPLIDGWVRKGITIKDSPLNTIVNSTNPLMLSDGLRYIFAMRGQEDPIDVVFKEKFGENWIENKKVRAAFLMLLVESGNVNPRIGDVSYVDDFVGKVMSGEIDTKSFFGQLDISEDII